MQKNLQNIRVLTTASLLAAMSVVIGIFCKSFLNFGDGLFRITFENMPIILSGILYGPVVDAVVGLVSDLTSYLLSPQTYPLNLVVTVGACVIGLVSGLVSKYLLKKTDLKQIITATFASHLIGSVIIKSIGLFAFYQWAVLLRIPTYLIIASLEAAIIHLLYRNNGFRRLVAKAGGESL